MPALGDVYRELEASGTLIPGDYRAAPVGVVPQGDILAAIDANGLPHLLIPLQKQCPVIEDRRSRGVHIRRHVLEDERGSAARYIDIVCLAAHLTPIFCVVAEEMMMAVRSSPADASAKCRDILQRWRELLNKDRTPLLSDSAVIGLFGELLVVQRLVEGNSGVLSCWRGPLGERHDFRSPAVALEVKSTIARYGRFAEVNGHDQLEPPCQCSLYLEFLRLEQSQVDGQTLPELIASIHANGVDAAQFFELLSAAGYDPSHAEQYGSKRFRVVEDLLYEVTSAFPAITTSSFVAGSLPPGVVSIRYTIDLTNDPPTPLGDELKVRVLASLTGRDTR